MAKKSQKKTEQKTKKRINFLKPITTLFSDENKRLRLSMGAILLLVSVYQTFAFISYFFTWKQDQDKVINKDFYEFIFSENDVIIDNHLGKLGAWVSHLFIYEWFGLASFLFPFVFVVFGIYLIQSITSKKNHSFCYNWYCSNFLNSRLFF